MKNSSKLQTNLISGILFAALALSLPVRGISIFRFASFPAFAGYVLTAVMLIMGKRDLSACIGYAAVILSQLISIVQTRLFFQSSLTVISFVFLLLFAVTYFTDYLPQIRTDLKKLWFLPAICIALSFIRPLIISAISFYFFGFFSTLITGALYTAAFLFACAWIAFPDGLSL